MKTCLLVALMIGVANAARPEWNADWRTYKELHGKIYQESNEENMRRDIWEKNRDKINKHNAEAAAGKHSYTMGDNKLSDKTNEELVMILGTRKPSMQNEPIVEGYRLYSRQTPPASLDLRTSVCMPPVKDQRNCGSCWAFGATTPVEFNVCNTTATKTSIILSESQLVNCSFAYGNQGCNGGWYASAWEYVIAAPGQATTTSLPYYPASGTCKYSNATMNAASVLSYAQLPRNESIIRQALATRGPLAAAIFVNTTTFNRYKSGVYIEPTCPKTCSSTGINHAVVLVGYGTSNTSIPFWIVRNSWGPTWGDQGYVMIRRGLNMCNIECFTYYVTVKNLNTLSI